MKLIIDIDEAIYEEAKNNWNYLPLFHCKEIWQATSDGTPIPDNEKQIQEPKTGYWIFDDECKEHGHCSHCGYGSVDLVDGEPHNFCRKCGAKMIEPQESEG